MRVVDPFVARDRAERIAWGREAARFARLETEIVALRQQFVALLRRLDRRERQLQGVADRLDRLDRWLKPHGDGTPDTAFRMRFDKRCRRGR